MTASRIRRFLVLSLAVVLLQNCEIRPVPAPPTPGGEEDPITHVTIPGAYGVKGGDQILQPSRQTSVLVYGNTFTYRILDPSTLSVVSLSGLPVGLEVGDAISLHYRYARGGKTLESELYENVQILMTNDKMAWLKKNDDIFFVIQLL